jgi:2-C-methyl-D-erythritol 4-phosphate cytidylyltransferase
VELRAWAIVPAAGRGERLGSEEPKPFRRVGRLPMLAHVLVTLSKAPAVEAIVVAAEAGWQGRVSALAEAVVPERRVVVVKGGDSRRASVARALAAVPGDADRVVVHDAARPLVTVELVEAVLAALDRGPAAICAVPVADTLKRSDGVVVGATIDREGLWHAQTPQAFRTAVLREAHERAEEAGVEATDDSILVERLGEPVLIVPGDPANLKVTSQADLELAEALLAARGEGSSPE